MNRDEPKSGVIEPTVGATHPATHRAESNSVEPKSGGPDAAERAAQASRMHAVRAAKVDDQVARAVDRRAARLEARINKRGGAR